MGGSNSEKAEMAALARGAVLDPELQAVAQQSDADLLVRALKNESRRGYARGWPARTASP